MSVPAAHRNALAPGASLLWYRIDRVLGQGAFGITYLAIDANLHRPVAIKEFLPGQLARREDDATVTPLTTDLAEEYRTGLARFVSEARTLARFEHPNIVRVHNVFEANGTAYMVMQYEEGEGLDRRLKRQGPLEEAEILRLVEPLLSGLEAIHDRGFVHRDIKPANIFIRADGSPVLLDFGSARQAAGGEARTLTNFVSPGYAPIEQYAGKSDQQGPWSDLYGLGATLYRAMTGRAPADAVDRSHSIAIDTRDTYEHGIVTAQGRYSPRLLAAVDHALQFRAQDRPQSVAQWRAELGLPGGRAPVDPGEVPTLDATGGATTGAGAATSRPATAAGTGQANPGTADARPDAAPRPQHRRWTRSPVATLGAILVVAIGAGALLGRRGPESAPATPSVQPQAAASAAGVDASPGLAPPASASQPAVPATTVQSSPLPTPIDPLAVRRERIASLLYAAGEDLDALRLMSPPGRNAHEKYREVLALEPGQPAALRGIETISDRYLDLVHRELGRDNLARAGAYLEKAEQLTPGRPPVLQARQALEERRRLLASRPPAAVREAAAAPPPTGFQRLKKRFGDIVRGGRPPPRDGGDSRAQQYRERLGGN
ncbi:MAG: protein kinase [Gammaproteobacteria bacterium]